MTDLLNGTMMLNTESKQSLSKKSVPDEDNSILVEEEYSLDVVIQTAKNVLARQKE